MIQQSKTSTTLLAFLTKVLDQHKAQAILALDVRALSSWVDMHVICTATSNRHAKALAEEVNKSAKNKGLPPLAIEGLNTGEWILIAFHDIVLHIMQPAQRDLYQLEKLWGDPAA